VITIGQLAGHVGISTKTIRVYHAKGLLPEPERDASGYRRYGAGHAIELIKIRTLAEAGVPLARIRDLRAMPDAEFRRALGEIEATVTARIVDLRATQQRLRELAQGRVTAVPDEVVHLLELLSRWGFTPRWVSLQSDLWMLVFATHPESAAALLHDQQQILNDPASRRIFLDYDQSHDLDPEDPHLDALARRMADATRARYGAGYRPAGDGGSGVAALIQGAVNASSPAWQRIDVLVRQLLGA